ncbi:hypothetical protein GJAV_G00047440 [Gymnothorax javanicus]|nr:hypothetical protein GJAV_G00047440 [Gymnothorax javanicus]
MKEFNNSTSADTENENNIGPVVAAPALTETQQPCASKIAGDVVVLDSDSDDSVCEGILLTKPVFWRRREVDPDVSEVIVLSDEDEPSVEKPLAFAPHRPGKQASENSGPVDSSTTLKRKPDGLGSDSQGGCTRVLKKRRDSLTDDSEAEGPEPSWKNQEDMVKKLQRKFPSLEKEEIRDVLQEHDWQFEDTLEALSQLSEPVDDSSLPECREKEPDSQIDNGQPTEYEPVCEPRPVTVCRGVGKNRRGGMRGGRRTSFKSRGGKSGTSSPSCTDQNAPNGVSQPTRVSQRQRRPRTMADHYSGSEGDSLASSDGDEHSEYSDSDKEDRASHGQNDRILGFFQEASLDDLSLIAGCSAKKAQKIVDLRPFKTWEDLVQAFTRGNGLSLELLHGCRRVIRERDVILGLMTRCEDVTEKMTRTVTQVIKGGEGSVVQPEILNSKFQLKPYQLVGLNWLTMLYENDLNGILADEMGLGKTIQAIAFLASLYEGGVCGPHLIVVPASTLDNWVRELNLWCPSLKVLVYKGSIEERKTLRYSIQNNQVEYNVIMSTYNLTIGTDSDRGLFRKLELRYAVFDEGHMLKNMNSLRYRHLMAINAQHRLLLTGTPLQNNLLELMSLLNFIMPSMFSSSTSQINKMFSMKSSEEQNNFEKERITQAKLIMKPFILRRVKSEVLKQLPEKEEIVEFCAMTEKQEVLYSALFQQLKGTSNGEKRALSNVMMQLRKMANHPLLHRQYYTSDRLATMSQLMLKEPTHKDANPAMIQEDMEVMSDFELHQLCQHYPSIQDQQLDQDVLLNSGKFHHLTKLLASLKDQGDRVVLFSQFTMMLDIVEVLLKHLGHRYVRLDGSTPIADRIVLIDEFNNNSEIFVFLLSTRAGGLGINLTSANVVILHDIDCNPYNDKQAEDRCHRVGQTRTVRVIKLISKDSIEDCMLRVGQKKLKLEQDMTASEEGEEGSMPEDMATLISASLGLS